MLVLTRRPSEELLIGDDIVVRVLDVRGSQVKLAVEAPPHVEVDRREIRNRKEKERKG